MIWYHISYHIISFHISYHVISYQIILYHIISYIILYLFYNTPMLKCPVHLGYGKSGKLSPQKFSRVLPPCISACHAPLFCPPTTVAFGLGGCCWTLSASFLADAVMSRKVSRNWFRPALVLAAPSPNLSHHPELSVSYLRGCGCATRFDIIYCKIISVLLLLCGCLNSGSRNKQQQKGQQAQKYIHFSMHI